MKITTCEGLELTVTIGTYKSKNSEYDGLPTIRFGWPEPSPMSYFCDTFNKIEDGRGLCLDGNRWSYQSIDADQVRELKVWMNSELNDTQ